MMKDEMKNKEKNITELVFILDRSGSMSGLEADTIGGFNSLVKKQKAESVERAREGISDKVYLSTVLFDDRQEVLYDRVDINKVEPMNDKQYYVRGCTALLDAVGDAIRHIKTVHRYAREEDRPNKTLFIITTDGYENASRKYTYEKVKKLVEEQKEKANWEFLFLGANIDAVSTAGRFGIAPEMAVDYECDSEGTQINYEVLSQAVSSVRMAKEGMPMAACMESDWAEPIKKHYQKRRLFR